MNVAFDHAVVVVPELAAAVRAFSAAGFVVTPGGRHDALPTENALIVFADGGYLELLAPRDDDAREALRVRSAKRGWEASLRRGSAIGRRFLPNLVGPPGVCDWVLRAEHLARVAAEMRPRGFAATGPVAMSRERTDGVRLEWDLVLPAAPRLPFFIADRTPRGLRVPEDPAARAHPNGATGVAEVRVRVPDLAPAALEYADLFGTPPRAEKEGGARLSLGGIEVVLEVGEPEGARGVVVSGVRALPAEIEVLGVCALEG